MKKYIWQRIMIIFTAIVLVIGISGIFMDKFYTKHYTTDVRILSNVESSYNKVNPQNKKEHDVLGRYVKVSYRDNNGETHKVGEFYSYNNYVDKNPGYRYRQLKNHHIYITDRAWLIVIMVLLMVFCPIVTLFICGDEMNLNYSYKDKQKIALFRLIVFCWWHRFIGYPEDVINEFYKDEYDRINIKYYNYNFHIKPYLKLRQEFNDIINERKSQIKDKN